MIIINTLLLFTTITLSSQNSPTQSHILKTSLKAIFSDKFPFSPEETNAFSVTFVSVANFLFISLFHVSFSEHSVASPLFLSADFFLGWT
jgi:multisubunit Na+/H+ antiporter MnhB subunit